MSDALKRAQKKQIENFGQEFEKPVRDGEADFKRSTLQMLEKLRKMVGDIEDRITALERRLK